ncbi:MAG: glucose-6-phosphate dehydrogenase [Acidobacteriota bacterium]|nr:glucose-6-phosphate dehydrogenase [Acidobacteriota bacterium]
MSEGTRIRQGVIFGASGDLTTRYLLPAFAELWEHGKLPDGFHIQGVAPEEMDDETFRRHVAVRTRAYGRPALPDAFIGMLHYVPGDVTNPTEVQQILRTLERPLMAYLAIPPALFLPAVDALAAAGADTVSHVVVEKPFGTDLPSACALNARLHKTFAERAVFRMDHFLGHQTVQNIIGLRFANRLFEPVWNAQHIERVEIVWDETITAAGRAGFYDQTGALRDMLQNHLLQLLALVAMEPPHSLDERVFRNRKADVLAAVPTLTPEEVVRHTVRGRYGPGHIDGRPVPGYLEEAGVDPERQTETYAEVTLTIDNWRWAGVPFTLRSGKALGTRRRSIAVQFKCVPHLAFLQNPSVPPNVLELGLQPDRVTLHANVNGAGDRLILEPIALEHTLPAQDLSAYARLLLDVLNGDPSLAIRDDEIEESWRIVTPILSAWADGSVPLVEYPAGSGGPGRSPGFNWLAGERSLRARE